jgi:hypothetical protein
MTEAALPKDDPAQTCMTVEPGVCGFVCRIAARPSGKRAVSVNIQDSECRQIQQMAEKVRELTLKELFTPISRNPVYQAAQQSGCHASCVVPAAVLKTVEVAMGMALARDVRMAFGSCEESR